MGGGEGWSFNNSSCIMLKVVRNNSTKKYANSVQNKKGKMDFVPAHFFQDCLSEMLKKSSMFLFSAITFLFLQITGLDLARIIRKTYSFDLKAN